MPLWGLRQSQRTCIINWKSLGYTSSDISDPNPITPNILLMGQWDPATPHAVYSERELLSWCKWKQCQVLADQFWAKFIRDYLPSLQTRTKWQQKKENLIIGSTVMVVDPQLPRALWLMATSQLSFPELMAGCGLRRSKSKTRPTHDLLPGSSDSQHSLGTHLTDFSDNFTPQSWGQLLKMLSP